MQNLSPKVQNLINQYQEITQRLQTFASQRLSLEMQLRELEHTIEELEKSPKDATIFKSVGSILIQTNDRAELIKDINEQKETVSVRAKSFQKQEQQLKERHDALQKQIGEELGAPVGDESHDAG